MVPNMTWSFFVGGQFFWSFSGRFGRIRAKILRTTKNLPGPTPMRVPIAVRLFLLSKTAYYVIITTLTNSGIRFIEFYWFTPTTLWVFLLLLLNRDETTFF